MQSFTKSRRKPALGISASIERAQWHNVTPGILRAAQFSRFAVQST